MIRLTTNVLVPGVSAAEVCHFMIYCDDARYHGWWPEAHFRFHTIERKPGNVGNLVYYDELVGKRRLRFRAVITEFVPNRRIVWQMKAWIPLPAWLSLEFRETPDGLFITHTLVAGFDQAGRLLDPLIRVYLNRQFEKDLDEHARTEFKKLALLLRQPAISGGQPAI
jgi:hypothetical protein